MTSGEVPESASHKIIIMHKFRTVIAVVLKFRFVSRFLRRGLLGLDFTIASSQYMKASMSSDSENVNSNSNSPSPIPGTFFPPSSTTMQLTLLNNDPIATILATLDGEPLYCINTPTPDNSSLINLTKPLAARMRSLVTPTSVKRLEHRNSTTSCVETEIGIIKYFGEARGMHLQLTSLKTELRLIANRPKISQGPTEPAQTGDSVSMTDDCAVDAQHNSWEFTGPDTNRYKWQMFIQSPVLMLNDNSRTPLARYRRAKIGIVSRPRRAFLEILPAGINIIDLIVVTFVTFMKQRLSVEINAE